MKTKQTEAAIDPVCGMDVNPDTAKFKLEQAGKMYYFCSAHCREKFRANPEDYLSARRSSRHVGTPVVEIAPSKATEKLGTQPRPDRRIFVCPMDFEVRQVGPGRCPKCGMALEPESPVAAPKVEYTCRMHPEVVRPAPGACPVCGMALELRTVTAAEEENPENFLKKVVDSRLSFVYLTQCLNGPPAPTARASRTV